MKYMIECWQENDELYIAIGRQQGPGQSWHFLDRLPESGWIPSREGFKPSVLQLPTADVDHVTFTPLSRNDSLLEVRRRQVVSRLKEVLETLEDKG